LDVVLCCIKEQQVYLESQSGSFRVRMEPPASSFCELVSSTTGIESRRVQLQLEKPRRLLLSPIQSNPLRSVEAVEKEGRPSPSNSILAEPTLFPDGYGTLL
jgi:hypothetical protein